MIVPIALAGLLILGTAPLSHAAAEFHVAPRGNDAHPGTARKPFASLTRARDAVRSLKGKSGAPREGITVYLHGGDYPFAAPAEFEARDSGTAQAPVVYRAFQGERPVFCGGVLLKAEGWTPVEDPGILQRIPEEARGKVLQIDLTRHGVESFDPLPVTGMAAGSLFAHKIAPERPAYYELFFDDRALPLARWPNTGYVTTGKIIDPGAAPRYWTDDTAGSGTYVPPEKRDPRQVPVFQYRDPRPRRWGRAEEPWLFMWNNFFADIALPIRGIDAAAGTIALAYPTGYGLSEAYDRTDKKYYVFNLLEEIDQPGEWYLDRKAGTLYCWPPSTLRGARVLLSRSTQTPFVLNEVSHLTLRGITIEGARGAEAIRIAGGVSNLVVGCTIRNVAGRAVTVDGGAGHAVRDCHIFNTGTGGISLAGGDRRTLTPAGHVAENNHIHAYARVRKSYSDAITLHGVGNAARHNRMHGAEHCAMSFRGNDHVIEYNEIFDVVRTGTDMGAVYTGRDITSLGNVIRYNYFHDIGNDNPGHGTQAIFLDDGASGVHIHGNVFARAGSNAAIKYHGGTRNVAENNVFVGPPPAVAVEHAPWGDAFPARLGSSKTIRDRLGEIDPKSPPWCERWPWLATVTTDPPPRASNRTLRNVIVGMGAASRTGWWSEEKDNFVTAQDPGFADLANGDYALGKDSAVFKAIPGFEPIPFAKMGLRKE